MRKSPPVNKGQSETVVATPVGFFDAVNVLYGPITFDLAASKNNAKCVRYCSESDDAFKLSWHLLGNISWLNPPYDDICRWVTKANLESFMGAHIIMLVPASVGSEWYYRHAYKNARTVIIRGRIYFRGHKDPYPKDLMLLLYGLKFRSMPVFSIWEPKPYELRDKFAMIAK